jgi:hypothetical protein
MTRVLSFQICFMSSDEYEYSSAPNTGAAQNVESSSVCKVCGNKDPVMYLGIQCCSACKMFFRRNTDFDLVNELFYSLQRLYFCSD